MFTEQNKSTWCVNAYHGMSGNNDGTSKMCCMIKYPYNKVSTKEEFFLNKVSILENFNNPHAIEIRESLNNGIRHEACSHCWQEEDGGRASKRIRDNNRYSHELKNKIIQPYEGLAKLELNLGNTCNIKCRTCFAAISSTWMKEDYDLNHKKNGISFKQYGMNMKKFHQTYDEDSPFWDDLKNNLHTIRQFDFYGGEPFLSKPMWEILRICVEKGYAKDIELHYNTNGTTWPEEIKYWQFFKKVNLSFSIDGVGERFEYMRYPAQWDVVTSNLEKARQFNKDHNNLLICWCITISSLNAFYLPETIKEHHTNWNDFGIYLNLVHNPSHFNISKLPQHIKEKIAEQMDRVENNLTHNVNQHVEGIKGFMLNGTPNPTDWIKFKIIVEKHDVYRNQSFKKTFPEFGELL